MKNTDQKRTRFSEKFSLALEIEDWLGGFWVIVKGRGDGSTNESCRSAGVSYCLPEWYRGRILPV